MKSMTGYGRSRFADEKHELEIEIKSVNSRFLDLKYRLPRELSFLETRLDEIINKKMKRGKVQININLKNKSGNDLELDIDNLRNYWEIYKKAAEILGVENDVSLSKVMAENDVIIVQKEDPEDPEFLRILLETFQAAVDEHQKMALQEGESMRKFILESCSLMINSVSKLQTSFPVYKQEIHSRMKQNIENLLQQKLDDEALKRIMLEAAVYIDKADITEEIVRLNDHIIKLQQKVKLNDNEAGKSINFILQEMHREINTIGSKYNSTKIFDHILLIKEEIEKCREIVQNVE